MVPGSPAAVVARDPDGRSGTEHIFIQLGCNGIADSRSYRKANQCGIPSMGSADSLSLAQKVEHRSGLARGESTARTGGSGGGRLIVLLVASIIFLTSLISPPRLMDDVDAVQAQISRNMLQSGDWVSAQLDGIKYLEKAPLKYWMIAV